jgi:hypothetical protein
VKSLNLALLGLGVVALGGLGVWTILSVSGLEAVPCHPPLFQPHPPAWLSVGACVAAFGLGHLVGRSRRRQLLWRPRPRPRPQVALYVHLALVALLLVGAGLLAYETLALAFNTRFWPITYYVRCGAESAAWATIPGAAVVYFLVGHWLWFPSRPDLDEA